MNYEEMSWHEINMAVTCIENNCQGWSVTASNTGFYHCGIDGSGWEEVEVVDYSKPENACPIILQTCMTIELAHPKLGGVGTNTIYNPLGTDWQCDYEDNKQWLRAAMICFLKMKESENG